MAKKSDAPDYFAKDEKYYRADDMAVLGVGEKKYRLNTRWLKTHSPRFKKLVNASDNPCDEDHPLIVPDVTTAQFEALLDFIEESNLSGFSMPANRWADLLVATYHLRIESIKSRVVQEVFNTHFDAFGSVEQLVFYEAYAVNRTSLRRAVRQLIDRPTSLSVDETSSLSPALLSRIVAMREDHLRALAKPFGTWKAVGVADSLADGWVKDG